MVLASKFKFLLTWPQPSFYMAAFGHSESRCKHPKESNMLHHMHFGRLSMKPRVMSTFSSGSKVEKVQLIHIFHLLVDNGSRR